MSEETIYSESAAVDRIKEYILSRKDLIKIIEHLGSNPRGKFPFNPQEATDEIKSIFLANPEDFRFLVRRVVGELVGEWYDDDRAVAVMNNVPVIISSNTKIKLNEWNSKYEGIPVSVECQVVGVYKEETYTKSAKAKCYECGREEPVRSLSHLPLCGNKDCTYFKKEMSIDEKSIITGDIRTVLIEEPIEESKSSSPTIKECIIKDDAVAETFMGNKKIITGIFRSHAQKGKSTNKPMIHAISVEDLQDAKAIIPTKEEIKKFREMSLKEDYFDVLTRSWAPEIKFEDLSKLCVILALVGGVKVDDLKGIIHTFLVGDPGTGKTKILEFLLKVILKSAIAVGGTMSGSGVTVTMDTLPNRTKFPRAGIVPLCHGSAVALDELNQLPEEDIGKLYEAMASGVIHYNKGGFDEVFKAETTIIAGANPKGYEYNTGVGMLANIGLPIPLVTRFDLIINMIGSKKLSERTEIRKHILYIRRHGVVKYIKENNLLTDKDFTLLINYAKTFNPEFSDEAENIINDFQTTMEELQISEEGTSGAKRADNRTLESLYRIATAVAKLYFSDTVTKEHAIIAVEIYKKTLWTFNVKTEKGKTQLNMHDVIQDWKAAAEFTWHKLEEETSSKMIDGIVFYQRLKKDYPKIFKTTEDVDKWWKMKVDEKKLLSQGGYYILVD